MFINDNATMSVSVYCILVENKATEELDLVVTFFYISSSCLSRSVNKKNFTLKALRLYNQQKNVWAIL